MKSSSTGLMISLYFVIFSSQYEATFALEERINFEERLPLHLKDRDVNKLRRYLNENDIGTDHNRTQSIDTNNNGENDDQNVPIETALENTTLATNLLGALKSASSTTTSIAQTYTPTSKSNVITETEMPTSTNQDTEQDTAAVEGETNNQDGEQVISSASDGIVQEEDICPIECLQETKCVKGSPDLSKHPALPNGEVFDFHKEVSRKGYHCDCPNGLTGLRCGRKYETCGDDPADHKCYNGGKCLPGIKDIYGNEQQYCNCQPAINVDGAMSIYSGKYCESEIDGPLLRCTRSNEKDLCLNGGECNKQADAVNPCKCADGYTGKYCEHDTETVPDCTLPCHNGGTCRLGMKDSESKQHWQSTNGKQEWFEIENGDHIDFQYCECPSGVTGDYCEKASKQCGDIDCLHGGICVEILLDNGTKSYHCDCTKSSNNDKIAFAGQTCQYKSTSICSYDESTKKSTFCVHDGVCPQNPHEDCKCPKGFTGSHCEFSEEETSNHDYAQCNLQCNNGGTCRKGLSSNDQLDLDSMDPELVHIMLDKTSKFEHCACTTGFVGLHCDYPYISCGKQKHPCFHGSACTFIDDKPACVCTEADVDSAGVYCQHIAEDMCFESDSIGGDVLGFTEGNRGFCVNGGVCITNKESELACRCNNGFNGPHCEYIEDTKKRTPQTATVTTNMELNDTSATTFTEKYGKKTQSVSASMDTNGIDTVTAAGQDSGMPRFVNFFLGISAFLAIFTYVVVGLYARRNRASEIPLYPVEDFDNAPYCDDISNRQTIDLRNKLDDVSDDRSILVDIGPERDYDENELKGAIFI